MRRSAASLAVFDPCVCGKAGFRTAGSADVRAMGNATPLPAGVAMPSACASFASADRACAASRTRDALCAGAVPQILRGAAAGVLQKVHAACGHRPTGRGRCCYTCRHDETGTGVFGAHRMRARSHARATAHTRRRRNRVRARIRNRTPIRGGRRIGSGERASRSARGRAHRIVRTGCARDRAERTMRAGFIRG